MLLYKVFKNEGTGGLLFTCENIRAIGRRHQMECKSLLKDCDCESSRLYEKQVKGVFSLNRDQVNRVSLLDGSE